MGDTKPNSRRILLVDDEEEVRSTLKLLLALDHHEVVEAAHGVQALERYAPGRFDLVITDYTMPEMKGDALARELKKQEPDLPILMITANVDMLPSELEVDFLLPKPFQIAELREAIGKVSGVSAAS